MLLEETTEVFRKEGSLKSMGEVWPKHRIEHISQPRVNIPKKPPFRPYGLEMVVVPLPNSSQFYRFGCRISGLVLAKPPFGHQKAAGGFTDLRKDY